MFSFAPTAEESSLVDKIFSRGEPHKLGVLSGDVALDLFNKTNLPVQTLSDIWSIADTESRGSLTPKQTAVAVRLTGWAQAGVKPTVDLLEKPGPLAHIPDTSSAQPAPPKPPPPVPPFTPEDKTKFRRLFLGSGPVDGLIQGDKAREIFAKSKLPAETLSKVWELSDTEHRGALDATDFAIAMHLIQWLMTAGQYAALPDKLPAHVYEQAAAGPSSPLTLSPSSPGSLSLDDTLRHAHVGSASPLSPPPPFPSASSSNDRLTVQEAASRHHSRTPSASSSRSSDGKATDTEWDVPPDARAEAERQFRALDPLGNGFIHDNISLPYLLESKLPPDDLAGIWTLADLNGDGKLTRDGFAIALFLIEERRQGKSLPTTLPSFLKSPTHSTGNDTYTPIAPTTSLSPGSVRSLAGVFERAGAPTHLRPPERSTIVPPPPPLDINGGRRRWAGKGPESHQPADEPSGAPSESARRRASTVGYPTLPPPPPPQWHNPRMSTFWPPQSPPQFMGQPPTPAIPAPNHQDIIVAQLNRQLQETQSLLAQLQLSNVEKATTITNLSQENGSLRAVIEELEVQVAGHDPESQKAVNEVLAKENEGLRAAMQQLEETLKQLQAASSDVEMQRIQYDDLLRENERLSAQVQEMRESTTQLPWSGGDSELQTLINEDLARENARLRTEAREMQENVAQLQEATAGYEEQRRVNAGLVADNERLQAEAQARQTRLDAQRREVRQLAREIERLKEQLRANATPPGPTPSGSNTIPEVLPPYTEVDPSQT